MGNVTSTLPFVVRTTDIPVSTAPDAALRVGPFALHALLRHFVPNKSVELAWIRAEHGRGIDPRRHERPSVLIVIGGKADLIGTTRRTVQTGDVITVPASREYRFTTIGPEGLELLHVVFGENRSAGTDEVSTLEQLLNRNRIRAEAALKTPYFMLFKNGGLQGGGDRERFRRCIRVFSDAFQTFLFTRQAMCRDGEYWSEFSIHLREELGHNVLLALPGDGGTIFDPILTATSTWFSHQMLLLDNVDKAVVNIVLETAGYHFHSLADPIFAADPCAKYFSIHAEADAAHQNAGIGLLRDQHPHTYHRLGRVLERAWDMLEAMTARIVHLLGAASMSTEGMIP
jgi:mannose-6-phosphate isomerase-like protein (cupin superfamily)